MHEQRVLRSMQYFFNQEKPAAAKAAAVALAVVEAEAMAVLGGAPVTSKPKDLCSK